MPAEQLQTSSTKRKLDHLVLNNPEKVKIIRKISVRKLVRELFKLFKSKIFRITGTTYITDKVKLIRRNHIAASLKSSQSGFLGKQASPAERLKCPALPTRTTSILFILGSLAHPPDDNRPLDPPAHLPL